MANSDPRSILAALAKLEHRREAAPDTSKRQYQRFVVRGDAELIPMGEDRLDHQPLRVHLRDVGRGGVGFLSTQPLETGSTWRMNFLLRDYVVGQQAMIVRYCRPVQGGLYLVGSQFCVETGLLALLGVDPAALRHDDDAVLKTDSAFLAPGEVA